MEIPMRRKDRQIATDEALNILSSGTYGVLSMCTTDNEGYGVPLNYVLWNNSIYFHCALDGAKIAFLKNNNKVSFCVINNTEVLASAFSMKYDSAIVFGTATEVFLSEKEDALLKLIEKYSKDFIENGIQYIKKFSDKTRVFKISVDCISGKSRGK